MATLKEVWQEKTNVALAASSKVLAHIRECKDCRDPGQPLEDCKVFARLSQEAKKTMDDGLEALKAFKEELDSSPFNDLEDQVQGGP